MNLKTLFRTKSVENIVSEYDSEHTKLKRNLGVADLTGFGIAAIIGAGIFSTIGEVCYKGGPAVVFLFILVAITCAFAAFCYSSFASILPISGSAYTYSYASFGELFAWIIGWDLIIEYAIGNIAVAISWSNYFTKILEGFGIHFPYWLSTDYYSASGAFKEGLKGTEEYLAYVDAPSFLNLKIIADFPAFIIVVLISWLVFVGIRETKRLNNVMVLIKLAVIFLILVAGIFYINPENWSPFMPNGFGGVLQGVSGVFFAYIGFDAISTTAEECKNPQRDLPRGMIYSLIICTVLYILIALVVTGIIPFYELENVKDPLAHIFNTPNTQYLYFIIGVSAIVAITTVLLVFQMGQPRIWMSMSRDKLLPDAFSKIHPRYKTPGISTWVACGLVAIPAMFLNITLVTDLTSIGTLFAFTLVCAGVLVLDVKKPDLERKFKIPYANAKYFLPILTIVSLILILKYYPEYFKQLIEGEVAPNFPYYIFWLSLLILNFFSIRYDLSLIPVLGTLSCLYLMSEIDHLSWMRFGVWLLIGLVIYFGYSIKRSKLNSKEI
ncbi:MAG: amino acid permease [Flavobacteriales bacterium]|nr:amino acid permease [Flavobacteriales bacterium]